jgi:hypothetical protein
MLVEKGVCLFRFSLSRYWYCCSTVFSEWIKNIYCIMLALARQIVAMSKICTNAPTKTPCFVMSCIPSFLRKVIYITTQASQQQP